MEPEDTFTVKTTLAVRSIEFCQCTSDEGVMRAGLGADSGHRAMIPLPRTRRLPSCGPEWFPGLLSLEVYPREGKSGEAFSSRTGRFLLK